MASLESIGEGVVHNEKEGGGGSNIGSNISSASTASSGGAFKLESIVISKVTVKSSHKSEKRFAVFEVNIEASAGSLRWPVHRRYSSFATLHQNLRAEGHQNLPTLPDKRLMGNFDPKFLEQRRVHLEAYLQELLQMPRVRSSSPFLGFIGAVQFAAEAATEQEGEPLTSFPYTFRSGRYSKRTSAQTASGDDYCASNCVVS